jgi:hypothetical protein
MTQTAALDARGWVFIAAGKVDSMMTALGRQASGRKARQGIGRLADWRTQ